MTTPLHVLVLANETVAGRELLDALRARGAGRSLRVTVVCPRNEPQAGLVVYEESRASAAERRLRRTLDLLGEAGIEATGEVVAEPDPLQALRDALGRYEPDEVVISTHPAGRSRWLRRDLVERARKASPVPVEHVVVDLEAEREGARVLVLANQTMFSEPLLAAVRERSARGPAEFTLVAPADAPGADERLRVALEQLAPLGVAASGRIGDPDPLVAALNAIHDEPVDELIVSTLPQGASRWLRRDLVKRLASATGLPVRHVVSERAETRMPA